VVIVNSTTGQTPAESPAPPDAGGVSVDGDSIVITSSSRSYPPQPTLHLANPTSRRLPILPLGQAEIPIVVRRWWSLDISCPTMLLACRCGFHQKLKLPTFLPSQLLLRPVGLVSNSHRIKIPNWWCHFASV